MWVERLLYVLVKCLMDVASRQSLGTTFMRKCWEQISGPQGSWRILVLWIYGLLTVRNWMGRHRRIALMRQILYELIPDLWFKKLLFEPLVYCWVMCPQVWCPRFFISVITANNQISRVKPADIGQA
jgi:hypothetical protein